MAYNSHALVADNDDVRAVSKGGTEEIGIATVAEFQAAAEFIGFQREIARGNISLRDALQLLSKRTLIHR